jgi:hypothetical protein
MALAVASNDDSTTEEAEDRIGGDDIDGLYLDLNIATALKRVYW